MTEIQIDQEALDGLVLLKGSHKDVSEGVCALELVAYLAGEPHSDHPACACPVLTAFVISLNDNWEDEDRQRLKPFLPRLIGTVDPTKRETRSWLALDWYIREHMPAWLDLAGFTEDAAKVRGMPPILSVEAAIQAMPILTQTKVNAAATWDAARAARAATWDAARDAARAAAGDAARAAAWAAGDAARDAARAAAGDAAWDAARAAAWAARDAAWDAAGAKLQPTTDRLQSSALELLDRMISC